MLPGSYFVFHVLASTEFYTLSLHDALPIWAREVPHTRHLAPAVVVARAHHQQIVLRRELQDPAAGRVLQLAARSEEHTSELQSRLHLVCRLLPEKKNHDQRRATSRR